MGKFGKSARHVWKCQVEAFDKYFNTYKYHPMAPEDIFPPLFEYASRSGLLPPPRCRPKQASWGLLILLVSLFWVGRLQAFMVQRFRALFI